MAMKVVDAGGTLRTVSTMYVRDGSTLRRILRMKVMDGATLRTVATFATPLAASISSSRTQSAVAPGPPVQYLIDYAATASPGGGLGPYTYSWALVSGSNWSFTASTSATTRIIGGTGSGAATARVTITDSAGQTDTADLALSE